MALNVAKYSAFQRLATHFQIMQNCAVAVLLNQV